MISKNSINPNTVRARALGFALEGLTQDEMCYRLAFQRIIIERIDDVARAAINRASEEAYVSVIAKELLEKLKPLLDQGKSFTSGRKLGTVGPIRKAISKLLTKNPEMKNPEIWKAINEKPPKGWAVCENRLGKYIEHPSSGKEMSVRRFRNICAEERKKYRD